MQKLADIKITVEQIEEVLPQTQCKLCQYAGCEPYAHAIVENHEQIDRCPPGGVRGLLKLAEITGQDASLYLSEMANKEKPQMRAVIREAECIGCTKCIQACPVDAILGSSKTMHTVIAEECTGCELCVAPCPVDCIDLLIIGKNDETPWPIARQKAEKARKRYQFRQNRLEREKLQNHKKHQLAKSAYKTAINKQESISAKKQIIAEAIARAKAKNNL